MSFPIKTNRLDCLLDRAAIKKKFDIFCVRTSDRWFKGGARILDAQELDKRILSLLFEQGNSLLILSERECFTASELRNALNVTDEAETITVSSCLPENLADWQLLQLLLNGLGNYSTDFLRFSNLTGHCYCFHPKWLKYAKKGTGNLIWQVLSLELKITRDLRFEFSVRTFTSTKLKDKIKFDKTKFSEYPQYVLTTKDTLRRKLKGDSPEAFILRQIEGQKAKLPFLDIKNIESFDRCKLGLVRKTISLFNSEYSGMANLAFAEITDYDSMNYTRACAKENLRRVHESLKKLPIKIVDAIQNEDSERFCKDLGDLFQKKYELQAGTGKRISKAALNIRLIHEEDYYKDGTDQHKAFGDAAVQHVTFENFMGSADFAIDAVVHELLIKQDIQNCQISLFDWTKTGLLDSVAFGMPIRLGEKDLYIFMNVQTDGSFDFLEEEFDLFHQQHYQDCINIFENAKAKKENVLGLIRTHDGKINVIKDAGLITLPEIDKLYKELSSGNTKLRGKDAKDEFLSACLDVKSFKKDNSAYYFVGTISENVRCTFHWAANVRKIEPYQDAPLLYKNLLPLMSVTFVHNGQLTVVPFPFKYLREYVKMRESKKRML